MLAVPVTRLGILFQSQWPGESLTKKMDSKQSVSHVWSSHRTSFLVPSQPEKPSKVKACVQGRCKAFAAKHPRPLQLVRP